MPIIDTYEKRKRTAEKADKRDVYVYDSLPRFFRQQVILIWENAIGRDTSKNDVFKLWKFLADIFSQEIEGFLDHSSGGYIRPDNHCREFLMECENVDRCLSLIELSCRVMSRSGNPSSSYRDASISGEEATEEINTRFREHRLGYEYVAGEIVQISNKFLHAETVLPAIALTSDSGFETANEDFMTAHRHYRAGEYKDAIVAANRAFESTLKAVCALRKWELDKGARASDLVTTVRKHELFPSGLNRGLDSYVAMMKTGLPEIRNERGGHGSGPSDPAVPEYLASYAIHLAASNIVLVIEAHKAFKIR